MPTTVRSLTAVCLGPPRLYRCPTFRSLISDQGRFTTQCRWSSEARSEARLDQQNVEDASQAADAESTQHEGNVQDDANSSQPSSASAPGALSQRLSQMFEDSLATETSSAKRQAIADAAGPGFDEDLRRHLEERLLSLDSAKAEHPQAFATLNMPSSAGRGTREIAAASAWTGEEALGDTALRMLTDAHKPLRGGRGQSVAAVVRMPSKRKRVSTGTRLAEARDRSHIYSNYKASEAQDEDDSKEAFKKELKARFEATARPMPATLSGLASLANERIEDAIARGQFKNLPRGKKLETDYNANSPFINTTEYLMNKMIKRQEIVPPWIEKQQEITSAVRVFRARLRNDWKRHAARTIAAKGGSLDEKIQRAREYAAAEAESSFLPKTVAATDSSDTNAEAISDQPDDASKSTTNRIDTMSETTLQQPSAQPLRRRHPFRDPDWEATERSFLKVSIDALNSQTRSYNLIAPQLAQKPYYNLERELKACFVDVAPLLPTEILERAAAPALKPTTTIGSSGLPLLARFERDKAPVHDEDIRKKGYGWREFWRDVWSSKAETRS